MRLTAIVKYIFAKRSGNLIVLLFFIFTNPAFSQKYSVNFTNIPLSEALSRFSVKYDIKVAFDAEKLSKVLIKRNADGNTPEEILKVLLRNTGFTYDFKHDTYLIIDQVLPVIQPVYQLMGSVNDQETGEQLAYSSLSLMDQKTSCFASDNGSFYFKNLKSNKVHLIVSYIGYFQVDTSLELKQPVNSCNIHLKKKYQTFDTLVVKAASLDMIDLRNNVDFATAVNPSKLIDLPQLTGTDVFKTLQLLPGVNYSENSSELSIRGGTSDQNLVLYDGQTLYNISHFFGLFSALNPNVIKDIQVYKGGFDSRYGERVSGIIDITAKNGNEAKTNISGEVSLFSGNISAEIPINKKITLVAAARRSYSDIYSTGLSRSMLNKTVIQVRNDQTQLMNESQPSFYFYDYNAKLTYHLGERENLSLSFYGGKDYFTNSYFSSSKDYNIKTNDNTSWGNYGMSALWQKQWNTAFYTTVLASSSGYSTHNLNETDISFLNYKIHKNHKYLPDSLNQFHSNNQNKLSDQSIQLRNVWYANSNHQINFGFLARVNTIDYQKDAEKIYVYDSISQSAFTTSAYVQDKIELFSRFSLKPGLRVSYFGGNEQFYLEPRLSLNYQLNDMFSVRCATGRYYQFLSKTASLEETGYYKDFWLLSDRVHPVLKSDHFIAGFSMENKNLLIDLEGYYKTFSGIEEYIYISEYLNKNTDFKNHFKKPGKPQPAQFVSASYFIDGTGNSYGLDLLLRYRYRKMTSWLSYSFGQTENRFPEINKDSWFPSMTDLTHQIRWANMIALGKWNFGSVSLFSTGRPFFNTSGNTTSTQLTRTWSRLPNFFRTDLSANYSFRMAKTKLKTGISLINVFNTHNYYEMNNRKFDFESASFSETNQMLSQDLSLNVFLIFDL